MESTLLSVLTACLNSATRLDGLTRSTRPMSGQSKKSPGLRMGHFALAHVEAVM
jgi:hypothetical protein